MREIGVVKLVLVQRSSLKSGEKPNKIYDPAPLMTVDSLMLSPRGVVGIMADGARIEDVHNADYTETKNKGPNGISVGFTRHYAEQRAKFGNHMTDGIGGENILVETSHYLTLADLGKRLAFQNPATGEIAYLTDLMAAPPCEPYSRFALRKPPGNVAPELMKATLQFLDNGMRGYYAAGHSGTVQAGDKVLVADE